MHQGILEAAPTLTHPAIMSRGGATPSTSDTLDAPQRMARGPVSLSAIMGRITRPALGKRGFVGADILAHWPAIVGPELAAFACPLQVKYPRGRNASGTLMLRVASGAAATLLQFKAPIIIARVNQFFGYGAVSQVQVSQGPLPPLPVAAAPSPAPEPGPEVTALVAAVPSGAVRAALLKLGAAVQRGRGVSVVTSKAHPPGIESKG